MVLAAPPHPLYTPLGIMAATGADAVLKVAIVARSENRLGEACKLFQQVLEQEPGNDSALEGSAYCYRKLGDLEKAISLYQACLRRRPQSETALYYLGNILYRQHRHVECQRYLGELTDLGPEHCSVDFRTGALFLLTKSHVAQEEYADAERTSQRSLEIQPTHPHFLFLLALVKHRLAEYDKALVILKQALWHCDSVPTTSGGGASSSMNSGNAELKTEIHDWLAQTHERKRDYRAARSEVDVALERDPKHVSALLTKALILIQTKRLEDAEQLVLQALEIDRSQPLGLVRLGYCKLLRGEPEKAVPHLTKAIQESSCGTVSLPRSVHGSARLYMALCVYLGQTRDVDGAQFHLGEARKYHRNFNYIASSCAREDFKNRDYDGLVNRLRAICDLDITTVLARHLANLLARSQKHDHEPQFREWVVGWRPNTQVATAAQGHVSEQHPTQGHGGCSTGLTSLPLSSSSSSLGTSGCPAPARPLNRDVAPPGVRGHSTTSPLRAVTGLTSHDPPTVAGSGALQRAGLSLRSKSHCC